MTRDGICLSNALLVSPPIAICFFSASAMEEIFIPRKRLSLSSRIWIGFFMVFLLVGLGLALGHLFDRDEQAAKDLTNAVRSKGEPFEDCLMRVQQENPSFGKELVERLCQGR